ncbi:MAG: 30S ribosomal protein S3 [Thermoplasmata archaeon HGW-Thermoplasmata-1]|nr:MAG: 30S ribosomal protein S3 [Thermoplasmata archaeon HGW-Thermoplasmata-1]
MAVERKFIRENVKRMLITEYLQKETERAGFGGVEIQRTPMGTRLAMIAERPGMVIGRKGATIKALTDNLSKKFKVENPQIEIEEAGRNAGTNAQIMAQKLAEALERGWHFRRAGHSTVQRVIQSGARGCLVVIAGKLSGERHRTEKFIDGHVKYCGDTADKNMDRGYAVAKLKAGVIGCTVRIMKPGSVLPSEVTFKTENQRDEEAKTESERIGREGGRKIINAETLVEPEAESPKVKMPVSKVPGIPPSVATKLEKAGVKTAADLEEITLDDLMAIKGIGAKTAESVKEAIGNME